MSEAIKAIKKTPAIIIDGANNSRIALYHFANSQSKHNPVILTHGSFSNRETCEPLAQFLQSNGFDCWVYEWQGHGQSSYGTQVPNAEMFAMQDTPVIIDYVLQQTQKTQCIWLAHSGGGFMPLMYLARNPAQQHKLEAMVLIATQATHAATNLMGKLRVVGVWLIGRLLGYVPGKILGLGPENESKGFLDQWAKWSWQKNWVGDDGFDYLDEFKNIKIKTLAITGGGDVIAPAQGCKLVLNSLDCGRKQWIHCAKERGFKEDYTHPRLVLSSSAKDEIWPQICAFLRS